MRLLAPGVLIALAVVAARAQDAPPAKVVRDEWCTRFRGAQKVSWSNDRLEEVPGAPAGAATFVVLSRGWTPLAEGEVRFESRLECDASGRVLRYESTRTEPWGVTTAKAESGEGGLTYRVKVRDVPERTGTLEEAWSIDVVALLVLRGAQPPGKRTLEVLDLPGEGTKERELEVKRDPEGWKVVDKDVTTWRTREGRFVRSQDADRKDEVALPAASEAQARDRAVGGEGREAARPHVEAGGVRIARPSPEWSVAEKVDAQLTMAGIEHACGGGVFVLLFPMRLPADERERLRFAEALRGPMNKRRAESKTGEGPELGAPEAARWKDLPAVRLSVGGGMNMVDAAGEAFLIALPAGNCAMILTVFPKDLVERLGPTVEAARAAVGLVPASEAPWARVTLGRVSLEAPSGWTRLGQQTRMKSLGGASQLSVVTDRMPPGLDLVRAQSAWAENQSRNPSMASSEVERQEDVVIDGRTAHVTVVRAKLKENNGVSPTMRAVSCALENDDGTFTEVTIVAFDLDWELAGLDRMLGSVRWVEEH